MLRGPCRLERDGALQGAEHAAGMEIAPVGGARDHGRPGERPPRRPRSPARDRGAGEACEFRLALQGDDLLAGERAYGRLARLPQFGAASGDARRHPSHLFLVLARQQRQSAGQVELGCLLRGEVLAREVVVIVGRDRGGQQIAVGPAHLVVGSLQLEQVLAALPVVGDHLLEDAIRRGRARRPARRQDLDGLALDRDQEKSGAEQQQSEHPGRASEHESS